MEVIFKILFLFILMLITELICQIFIFPKLDKYLDKIIKRKFDK